MTVQIDAIRDAYRACASRHAEIAVVYLFGSVARAEARPWRDVDLGVVYRQGMGSRAVHEVVAVDLAAAVAAATGIERVDVVELEARPRCRRKAQRS